MADIQNNNSHDVILSTRDLTRNFGNLIAVDNLNLTIKKKEIFGLLGPNGAGKSTLIKMLITLLAPTSGDAWIDGVSITKEPRRIRQMIGYVPQLISVDGALTGYENLLFFAKLYNIPRKLRKTKVNEALELMDLTGVADRLVGTYSGGTMRRLEIVQALLHEPKVLFLDEPTSGLDPIAKNVVWDRLLFAHKNLGTTILITSHDMEEVDALCDRVAILHRGKKIVVGDPLSLKAGITDKGDNVTMGDVFVHYTGDLILEGGGAHNFKDIRNKRSVSKVLGG